MSETLKVIFMPDTFIDKHYNNSFERRDVPYLFIIHTHKSYYSIPFVKEILIDIFVKNTCFRTSYAPDREFCESQINNLKHPLEASICSAKILHYQTMLPLSFIAHTHSELSNAMKSNTSTSTANLGIFCVKEFEL